MGHLFRQQTLRSSEITFRPGKVPDVIDSRRGVGEPLSPEANQTALNTSLSSSFDVTSPTYFI